MRETIQNANGKQFHAVSLSGGKDSTAMLLFDDRTGYAHQYGAVSGHRHGVPGNV